MSQDEFQQYQAKSSQYRDPTEPLSPFCQVTVLEIKQCSAIKFLFCNIAAHFFMRLQQLSITDCPLMEAIIMNEGTSDGDIITFSELKSLKLCNMPRLTSFYKQKKHMHSSSTSSITDNSIQPLFDKMVDFPYLEVLELSGLEDTSDIWSEQPLSSYTFGQLKSLSITNCNRLEIVFPIAMLQRLRKFEMLSITGCNSLISEVGNYDMDNSPEISQLEALTQMHLEMLPCLAKTGLNSRNRSGPINLYPNLHSLYIKDCSSLTNVFRPSTARVLVQLKEMRVSNCKMMNEIVGAGEEEITDGIEFPDLTLLQLSLLPNLTNFWRSRNGEATYKVVCPNLVDLELRLSGRELNLEAIEFGGDDSPCQLTSLSISLSCDRELQLPNAWQHRLYNLETLKLRPYWGQELKSENFQRLKVLTILESGCSILFTCSAFRSLQQLQELEISDCASLRVIVHYEAPVVYYHKYQWKLKLLILRDLPNLRSLVPMEYDMPNLEEVQVINCGLSALFTPDFGSREQLRNLQVSNCRLLESIFLDSRNNGTWDTISTLSSVVLKDLPNLKTFAYTANCEYKMPALAEVQVDNCGLSALFTSNVCKSLQQLRKLEIINCTVLEGIVVGTSNEVRFSSNERMIPLYKLSQIVLENLPNLECFSPSARYDFEMPALYAFRLVECPRLEKFTSLKTTTGLVSVYTEGQCWEEVPDLNDYIRQKHRAGSNFKDTAGELSSGNQNLDKEAVRVEEEQSLQETGASDQKLRKIEIQIFINSQHEVTATKASVHHVTLLE